MVSERFTVALSAQSPHESTIVDVNRPLAFIGNCWWENDLFTMSRDEVGHIARVAVIGLTERFWAAPASYREAVRAEDEYPLPYVTNPERIPQTEAGRRPENGCRP